MTGNKSGIQRFGRVVASGNCRFINKMLAVRHAVLDYKLQRLLARFDFALAWVCLPIAMPIALIKCVFRNKLTTYVRTYTRVFLK